MVTYNDILRGAEETSSISWRLASLPIRAQVFLVLL